MSTHNLCFEQKYGKYRSFLSENFQFLEMKFSIYLNRRVFVMIEKLRKLSQNYHQLRRNDNSGIIFLVSPCQGI